MDLDGEIVNSLQPTPIERANRGVEVTMGQHYNIYTTPILNPSPEQQVILQQVQTPSPKPKYYYDEIRPLPEGEWKIDNYTLRYKNGVYVLTESWEEPFLIIFRRERVRDVRKVGGREAAPTFITWLQDSNMDASVKRYYTNVVAAHINTHERARQTKSPLADTFQEVQTSDEIFVGVDPTGIVNADFFGTRYLWGASVSELPDL